MLLPHPRIATLNLRLVIVPARQLNVKKVPIFDLNLKTRPLKNVKREES
jgi:hypothetical protein